MKPSLKPNHINTCRSRHSSPSSVVCLCPSVCSPEVTVSSLHPPRLCRLVVFSIKPTLLSKHHHQPHWEPPIEIGVRRKRKKLGRAGCYKIVEWAHCSVTDRINNRRQRSKVGKPRNRGFGVKQASSILDRGTWTKLEGSDLAARSRV